MNTRRRNPVSLDTYALFGSSTQGRNTMQDMVLHGVCFSLLSLLILLTNSVTIVSRSLLKLLKFFNPCDKIRRFNSLFISGIFIYILSFNVLNGQVSISGPGFTYIQNFNTLPTTGTTNAWTDNSTISNWYSNREILIAGTGTNNNGGLYSFGPSASSDRALGVLSTGSISPSFGVLFQNNSGNSIDLSLIRIDFTGEQWRQNNSQTLSFAYQTSSTIINDLTSGTWVANTNLDLTSPQSGTAGALDGNLLANQVQFSNIALANTGTLPAGHYLMLRWQKSGANSPGLAIDDFQISIQQVVDCLTPDIENIISCDVAGTILDLSDQISILGEEVMVSYFFDGDVPTATNSDASLMTGQDAIRGAGIGGSSYVAGCPSDAGGNRAFTGTGWNIPTLQDAIDGEKYYEFVIENSSVSNELQITGFGFDNQRSGTGPTDWSLYIGNEASGFSGTTAASCATNSTSMLNIILEPGQTDTLSLYAWGASSGGGTWRVDNIEITATSGCPGSAFNIYDDDPESGGVLIEEEVDTYDPELAAGESITVWISRVCYLDCEGLVDPVESMAVEVTITYAESPEIDVNATSMLACEGGDIELMAMGDDVTSWQWSGPDEFSSNEQNPTITDVEFMNGGTYTVIGSNTAGCMDTATIDIDVIRSPLAPEVSTYGFCLEDERLVDLTSLTEFNEEEVSILYHFDDETTEGILSNEEVVTSGNVNRGAGLGIPASSVDGFATGCPSGEGGTNFAITSTGWDGVTLQEAIDNEDFYEIMITNESATEIVRMTNFSFNNERSGSGPTNWALYFSSNPSGNTGGTSASCGLVTFGLSLDLYPGETIPLRLYAWGASSALGTWRIDNVHMTFMYGGSDFTFNFYDEEPMPGVIPIASDVLSFEPMSAGTYWVAALNGGFCESEPVPFDVFFSEGRQNLACISHVNAGLNDQCELETDPLMFLSSPAEPEFITVQLKDQNGSILPAEVIDASYIGQTLQYILTDRCFGHSCWGEISIEDKLAPIIIAPDTTLICGDDTSVEVLNNITVTDCSNFNIIIQDVEIGDYCTGDRRIERTISAVDEYGNASSFVQVIHIEPVLLSSITAPTVLVETACGIISPEEIFAYTGNIEDAYPTIDGTPLMPNAYCNLIFAYEDHMVPVCDAACNTYSAKVTRKWTIYDWCNAGQEPLIFEQIISAKDNEPPIVDPVSPDPVTLYTDPWNCTATHTFTPPDATDICTDDDQLTYTLMGPEGVWISGFVATHIPPGLHEFKWMVEDCCGNVSESIPFLIHVYDHTPPVALVKEFIVISLDYDEIVMDGVARLYAESVDNGSYDQCGSVTLRIRRLTDPCRMRSNLFGESVTFCCRDINRNHEVEVEVTDASGNTSITWARVKVESKANDIVLTCNDIVVDCHEDVEPAIAGNRPFAFFQTCFINAPVIEVARDNSHYNEACNSGFIEIIYAVQSHPEIRCTQRVDIVYKGEFSCGSIHWPEESLFVTECNDIPSTDLTWDFGPCDIIGWSLQTDTFYFATDACAKIVNTYTVIDWCAFDDFAKRNHYDGSPEYVALNCNSMINNDIRSESGVYSFVEVIKLIDTIPPELLVCENPRFPIRDDCSRAVVLQNFTDDHTDCPNLIVRYELTVITEDGQVFVYQTTKKPGEIASISLTGEFGVPILFKGNTKHTAIWKVWDGCGNINSCVTEFSIIDDKAPTPYCVSVSSALMQDGSVELWAKDFDRGSFDNCDNSILHFTFENISPDREFLDTVHYFNSEGIIHDESTARSLYSQGLAQKWLPEKLSSGKIFTCEDFHNSPVFIRVTVWDSAFNSDFCTVELTLADNNNACESHSTATIAGTITTEDGRSIQEVEVELQNIDEGVMGLVSTDHTGIYAFPSMALYGTYSILPGKEDHYLNGVSTLDLLLIQRHILGIHPITSPYRLIAADVNNDKAISVQDITLLQRLILGIDQSLPSGVWKFIDASQNLNVENALSDYQESREIIELGSDSMKEDFIGVKMGDVNNNVVVSLRENQVAYRGGMVNLLAEDILLSKGEEKEVTFVADADDIYGFQLHMVIDGAEVLDVYSAEGKAALVTVHPTSGGFKMSFADANDGLDSKEMIKVVLRVLKSGFLSEMISLSKSFHSELYIGQDLDVFALQLTFYEKYGDNEGVLTVGQNRPNPFDQTTIIPFQLPEEGEVNVRIIDIHGRELLNDHRRYPSGYNEYIVDKSIAHMPSGLYYYTISHNGKTKGRKMIVID